MVARPGLRAVLYHHIADHASSMVDRLAVTTPPDVFEAHVRRMARDYQVVSLDDVLSKELPRRALLITFDDGYRSVAEVALPILRDLGLPSVFFVTGECLRPDTPPLDNLLSHLCASVGIARVGAALNPNGRPTGTFPELLDLVAAMPYERRLAVGDELAEHFDLDGAGLRADSRLFLDPADLAGLAAYGCEVANHSRTHVYCRSIVDETSAKTELVEHARWLESLTARSVRAFSYPYGRRDDATPIVERVLRESGHEAVFLAESRPHLTGPLGRLWNRVTLDGCPAWRLVLDIELKPTLRAGRDRMRGHGDQGPKTASSEYERSPTGGASAPLK
jgi:peptidoglycan/xylan/chitin deacetylase (PgdA/CDA1 family)